MTGYKSLEHRDVNQDYLHAFATDKTVWFMGEIVKLTSEVEHHFGAFFYVGSYTTGHKKGQTVHIKDSMVTMQLERDYPQE